MRYFAIWLSLICVLFFVLQLVFIEFTSILILNQASFFQPWRFLTAIFLHGSFLHLIFNLFALILFGLILEKVIGSSKFLIVFFVSGIASNLVGVNFYSSSLGASGAIYGVLGCLTILRPKMIVWVYNLPMPMFLAAFFWIAIGIIGVFVPSSVGYIVHLSGIISGFLFGLIFRLKYREKKADYSFKINLPENQIQEWEDRWMRLS